MPKKRSKPIIFKAVPESDIDPNGNVTHMNYLGALETNNAKRYCHKLICPCGNHRYYKSQDKKQVESSGKCKPCLRAIRLQRRKEKIKKKVIREVLKESL